MQNNFRSATNLRSLGRSFSNNTFATATNLGNISSNATRVTFRASSSVGKFDNVDFYKFTLAPGVSMSSGRESYRLKGGLITSSRYAEVQGQRFFLASKSTIPRGLTSQTTFLKNPNQVPATFYLKLEHRSNETRYNFTLDFFR